MRLRRFCYLCLAGLRPTPQPFWLSPPGRQPNPPHGWHNGCPKDRHGWAICTWGGQTVCPPMDVSCMDITAAGHFNHLLVYFMDTVSTGPNITDQTYVDQSFMDTTIMHLNPYKKILPLMNTIIWLEFFPLRCLLFLLLFSSLLPVSAVPVTPRNWFNLDTAVQFTGAIRQNFQRYNWT